ncbi:MAG TPA: SDR family NAD(P)-dependent oxidoreductase, partial [Mycobacterium sp.]|nr:SDR family NAD(P)-dependent oxidoreductase [Mycobacterium sp.]
MSSTLVDLLRQRAKSCQDRVAFRFSRDGEERDSRQVSYVGLDAQARRIAAGLQQQGAAGEPVLVLCSPGLDFIASYFGCLYAGAIAVPVHPPTRDHLVPRVESIIADIQPGFAITTAEMQAKIRATVDGLVTERPLRWFLADGDVLADGAQWIAPDLGADAVAMVQYTSGSTSAPKGVVLTHGNLVHNLEAIRQAWNAEIDGSATGVFWLPPFHDMGLIGGLLETLYVGGTSVLMPPTAFIKRPMRWLEAISRHRATITAAPNFAYDLCVELSTPEQRAALDLSSWSAALCGAEPVRTATLDGFAEAFAPSGFHKEAFLPVYGLAEGTLLVSGGSDSPVPVVRHVDRAALRENRVIEVPGDRPTTATLVGCGRPRGGQRVVIVDPETRRVCRPDEVGEIWLGGPSVAHGYWGSPEQSAETFAAYTSELSDTGEGPFLRTGDLGFLWAGELFVTGRRKDLIIIRGNNHYPNDIELTVQNCHPALMPGRGAVFAVAPEPDAAEQLVVVQEVNHSGVDSAELAAMIQHIRTAVTERHEIRAHAVVLVEPLQLPTTSSGKIQRSACRQQFLDGTLPVVTQWRTGSPEPETQPAVPVAPAGAPGAPQITDWLTARLAGDLELPVAEIDPTKPFAFYGLDSVHAVRLTTALEAWLGHELSPTLAYEYPTIKILADHLARLGQPAGEAAEPADTDDTQPQVADEPIAIVGIGCRFPGADGPAAFWGLLSSGADATGDVPADRWDVDAFYDPDPAVPGTAVTRRGGFLNRIDSFDYQFFGISPRESAQMDPQQRLLLEVAWEALEDAGQVPERLAGSRTGVFVGISTNDYGSLRQGQPQLIDAYSGTGNALSIAANRLSYVFDFHGPSMAIDTACSSSLVAVDLACRSLRDGECGLALAGGVNIILSPALAINFSKARLMAPDGHCKTFAADADGYVRGEGAGVVVIKPLSRALADNDPIYAVIRGTATNSDGRTNGLIAPSERAQEAVLAAAYRRAGLSPGAVQYVEAHGTGTSLGDAIEARALGRVLADGRPPGSRCLVGSVKTNIGHLEAAAGVAGLIKVALALQHRVIPPSLNFSEPNPHIPFDRLPLDVVQTLTPWPDNGGRAVAGVSSFGFGGTNAHVVLTEAPQVRVTPDAHQLTSDRAELLALSARSPEALDALVGEYEMALFSGSSGQSLADLCYTAGARRGHHDYRLAVVGDSPAAMFESLAAYRQQQSRPGLASGHVLPARSQGSTPAVTFVFSGQGSQWRAMGQQLQTEEPVFREALHECDRAIRAYLGRSVLDAFADAGADIGVIQPAIFAVQVALAALWRSWGVEPAAVVGHSMGEVAAAHVAGALSLDDAARVIWARSAMLQRVHGRGAMLVAEATPAEAAELIAGRESQVAIAASNSHRSTVLSGDKTVLAELMAVLEQRDRFCRWIDVDAASHSPQLTALATELRGMLGGLRPTAPTVPLYSTVTGELLTDRLLDPDYWVANLCSPVQFSAALRRLLEGGQDTFVEISPHPILLTAAREDAADLGITPTLLASMRRDDDGRATMLGSLGTLYTLGHRVAWQQLYPPDSRCISAPTYPWQRVHSWLDVEPVAAPGPGVGRSSDGPLWRGPLRSAAQPETVLAEVEIGTRLLPALVDHRVNGSPVLPAALLLSLIRTAATRAFGTDNPAVHDINLHRPLEFDDTEAHTVQLVMQGDPADSVSVQCYAAEPGGWSLLADAVVTAGEPGPVDAGPGPLTAAQTRCPAEVSGPTFYRSLADHGLQYGPKFQAVEKVWRRDGEAVARLRAAGTSAGGADLAAAMLLDAGFSTLAAALPEATAQSAGGYLPSGLTELQTWGGLSDAAWGHAVLRPASDVETDRHPDAVVGDVYLRSEDGAIVAAARGLRLHSLPGAPSRKAVALRDRIYQLRWQPASLAPDGDSASQRTEAGSWLIFSDGGNAADTLRDHLEAHSQFGVLVEPGEAFEQLAPDSYRIDPQRPEHFRRLLNEAFDGDRPPCRGVVHMWSLRAAPLADTSVDSLESATTLGPLSVLYLLQALTLAGWGNSPRLWLVTRGAQVTDPADRTAGPVAVAQAPVWGMSRSIDHEYPELRCSCVDLSADGGPEELRALFGELWADSRELDLALRGCRRYVARLTRYDETEPVGTAPTVDPNGSYLITGGLGALGGVVATWLVQQGARHLILMGRGEPSESAQAMLAGLRASGAEVRVARADVTRADQVAVVLESGQESMPPLRGVVHAAGIVDDGILQSLDERQLRDVMAPKVAGAWNLHT